MIEKVEHGGKLFAIILRSGFEKEGVNFFTPEDNPLQLGLLKHKRGTKIKPHIHKNVQEVLHMQRGKMEVVFYSETGEKIKNVILNAGDTILLPGGGHGFNIQENSKIVEVKQGPYLGVERDKEYFDAKG